MTASLCKLCALNDECQLIRHVPSGMVALHCDTFVQHPSTSCAVVYYDHMSHYRIGLIPRGSNPIERNKNIILKNI